MSQIQKYDDLIRAFAAEVGLDADAFAKAQEVVIDGVAVGVTYEGNADFGDLVYFAQLGKPSDAREADVHRTLLYANNLWAGTGGATLGLQQETGKVVMAGRLDIGEVTPAGLAKLLGAFADTALFWQKFIADEMPLTGGGDAGMAFGVRA
jgi:hypothetical protein